MREAKKRDKESKGEKVDSILTRRKMILRREKKCKKRKLEKSSAQIQIPIERESMIDG